MRSFKTQIFINIPVMFGGILISALIFSALVVEPISVMYITKVLAGLFILLGSLIYSKTSLNKYKTNGVFDYKKLRK
ncbi:MAG: hypothetical protein RSB87_03060 [Clostridia bacterium]